MHKYVFETVVAQDAAVGRDDASTAKPFYSIKL